METERKFLLNELPTVPATQVIRITQGYIATSPEVRVRSYHVLSGDNQGHIDYMLTVKGDGDLVREEIETYVSKEFFDSIVSFIRHPMIIKECFKYKHDGCTIECSIVDPDRASSFIYGEVEFSTTEEAICFKWPFGAARDVTYDGQYKMKNYWLRTRSEENVI